MTKSAKRVKLESTPKGHMYNGFKISGPGTKLDNLRIEDIDADIFHQKYVLTHTPCIISGIIPELDISSFDLSNIGETLAEVEDDDTELLQVEKKIDGGFGSGHERLKMSFDEFLQRVKAKNDEDLYLTTQYSENEEDEEDDADDDFEEENEKGFLEDGDFSETDSIDLDNLRDDYVDSEGEDDVSEDYNNKGEEILKEGEEDDDDEIDISVLQPPLSRLGDKFPIQPSILAKLVPQQINLWMGSTKASKGDLKELDPSKPHMGVGRRIPAAKNATSSGLHHDHSDNLYIPVKGQKRFTLFSPYNADDLYTVGDIHHIYPNGVIDYETNENAPNWKHVQEDGAIIDDIDNVEASNTGSKPQKIKKDPPSFSKIPPFYIHLEDCQDPAIRSELDSDFKKKFPKAYGLNSIQVELSRGQMLYLPCGWFHEVTSYGNEDGVHIALNYWFVPPVHGAANP